MQEEEFFISRKAARKRDKALTESLNGGKLNVFNIYNRLFRLKSIVN